ncbi:hypothetical protein N8254_04920, partial [Pseudomonadales bacterium]|nr:hypothetical protein [Pseudomonadales bacterium]
GGQKKAAKRREERLMSNTIATDSLFSADERDALKILVGMIIPASAVHNVPGADDELIFADILDSAKANEAQIRKGVEHAVFCGLGDDLPLEQVLPELEGHPAMAPLVSLVMQCYYRDDRIMVSLEVEPRAPFPKGFEVPQGDWTMLDAVQKRGKIWRDA